MQDRREPRGDRLNTTWRIAVDFVLCLAAFMAFALALLAHGELSALPEHLAGFFVAIPNGGPDVVRIAALLTCGALFSGVVAFNLWLSRTARCTSPVSRRRNRRRL